MEKKICCILGAGEYFDEEYIPQKAFIIAADGGLKQCRKKGLAPDMIIGDFDSLGYETQGKNVVKLPVIKDDTDTFAAVKAAMEKGFQIFLFYGCTGGRLSHTVANLQTLNFIAKRGGIGFLVDKDEVASIVCKGIEFDEKATGFLSVFAFGGNCIVSENGLKYEIQHCLLPPCTTLGTSNEFIQKKSALTIHEGAALVVFEKENLKTILTQFID